MKMTYKRVKIFVAGFLFIAFITGGCGIKKKRTEAKIEGTWQMMNFVDPASIIVDKWKFDKPSGKIGNITWLQSAGGAPDVVQGTGKYSIEAKLFTTYLNIADFVPSTFGLEGRWEIAKLKNKTLIIVLDEKRGIYQKEFIKVD